MPLNILCYLHVHVFSILGGMGVLFLKLKVHAAFVHGLTKAIIANVRNNANIRATKAHNAYNSRTLLSLHNLKFHSSNLFGYQV